MGDLLSPYLAGRLAAWGLSMRGKIVCRQKCPVCGTVGRFSLLPGAKVMVCQCSQYPASQFDVYLWWNGKTRHITHDQQGERLATYVHAERALGEINNQIERKAFFPELWASARSNRLLWENYLEDYLERERERLLPERRATWDKKKSLGARLRLAFAGHNIREIRTAHVQDWANSRELRQALSPKTLADLISELRHIFNQAVGREDIERAPQVPTITVPEKEIGWLAPDHQARVLEHIPARHRPIFAFMFTYGPRVSEACALCWDKIERGTETFSLSRTFSRRRLAEKPKTKRSNVLPITPDFAAYLDAAPRGLPDMPVFINLDADPHRNPKRFYVPDFLNTIWAQASEAAGVAVVPLKNGTRHSRGMQAINLEHWSLEEVRRLLGHTSQAHTRRYAEAGVELLRGRLTKSLPVDNGKGKNRS
ncbi:MAG: tyrosine-type recombinase/integrase [Pseudomonadota bacterium]